MKVFLRSTLRAQKAWDKFYLLNVHEEGMTEHGTIQIVCSEILALNVSSEKKGFFFWY